MYTNDISRKENDKSDRPGSDLMFGKTAGIIAVWALSCTAALASDTIGQLEQEKEQENRLTAAMQNAQLLLGNMSDAYDCDYSGYHVQATAQGDQTTYRVVIDVQDGACDDMVNALNAEGAEYNLAFVSEKALPKMTPLTESGPAPFDEFNNPPMDYSLIHEVDPAVDE
jgi:hypothetical protein